MTKEKIDTAAKSFYIENIVGEPLDEDTPIICFTGGADFMLAENKKAYKIALKSLEPMQKEMMRMRLHDEWMKVVNALRICAGMETIELKS